MRTLLVMRALLATILGLGLTCAALAATPEEDYIAARDAAIAKIKAMEAKKAGMDTVDREIRKGLAGLEPRLRAIVGELNVKPYPAKGKIAADTLSEGDVGFGGLDAMLYSKGDQAPAVYVTTEGLLENWLRTRAEWWKKSQKTPPGMDAALASEEFVSEAISGDAALAKTADIPVTKPSGATFATAMLGGWTQDIGPVDANEIVVSIRRGGKVYIATEQAKTKIEKFPACEKIWKESEAAAEKLLEKYNAGGGKDETLSEAHARAQEKGDADYHACQREKTPQSKNFLALIKEAQEIADRFKNQ